MNIKKLGSIIISVALFMLSDSVLGEGVGTFVSANEVGGKGTFVFTNGTGTFINGELLSEACISRIIKGINEACLLDPPSSGVVLLHDFQYGPIDGSAAASTSGGLLVFSNGGFRNERGTFSRNGDRRDYVCINSTSANVNVAESVKSQDSFLNTRKYKNKIFINGVFKDGICIPDQTVGTEQGTSGESSGTGGGEGTDTEEQGTSGESSGTGGGTLGQGRGVGYVGDWAPAVVSGLLLTGGVYALYKAYQMWQAQSVSPSVALKKVALKDLEKKEASKQRRVVRLSSIPSRLVNVKGKKEDVLKNTLSRKGKQEGLNASMVR